MNGSGPSVRPNPSGATQWCNPRRLRSFSLECPNDMQFECLAQEGRLPALPINVRYTISLHEMPMSLRVRSGRSCAATTWAWPSPSWRGAAPFYAENQDVTGHAVQLTFARAG